MPNSICTNNLSSTTTSSGCVECIHPFVYLFQKAQQATGSIQNTTTFHENLLRILDKGLVTPSCNICCPTCVVYHLGNIETSMIFLSVVNFDDDITITPCCVNTYSNLFKWVQFDEQIAELAPLEGFQNKVFQCCNGFTECVDNLLEWAAEESFDPSTPYTALLSTGIMEYGTIENNCSETSSSICLIKELYDEYCPDLTDDITRTNAIQSLLDKGIAIYCNNGVIAIASSEEMVKFLAGTT
jgi:hypothetical protein